MPVGWLLAIDSNRWVSPNSKLESFVFFEIWRSNWTRAGAGFGCTAFVGLNGSGKSSVLESIALLRHGEVEWDRAKSALASNPEGPNRQHDRQRNAGSENALDRPGEMLSGRRSVVGIADIMPVLFVAVAVAAHGRSLTEFALPDQNPH